jgi:ParB family chromosome partitioning protein
MSKIEWIPITAINVLNPRSRNKRVFASIIANIGSVGLKKPVSVTRRAEPLGEKLYDLVYGQGRVEAFQALGMTEIPAIVTEVSRDEAYLRSLVENIARRHHTPLELLKEITILKDAGLSVEQIGLKLDLDRTYVYSIIHLLENGEEALVKEVERGRIPLSVAIKICNGAGHDLQAALREAYTSGELRGQQLIATRRFLARRRGSPEREHKRRLSGQAAVRAYKQFTMEHKSFVKRARQTEQRLLLIVSAMKTLMADGDLVSILRSEHLETIPAFLLEKMRKG